MNKLINQLRNKFTIKQLNNKVNIHLNHKFTNYTIYYLNNNLFSSQSNNRFNQTNRLIFTSIYLLYGSILSIALCNNHEDNKIDDKIDRAGAIKELCLLLKEDQVELDEDERKSRGKPWSSYHSSSSYPDIIVYPESTKDVSDILKICYRYSIPVIAFGGGTSIEGHTITYNGGVSIDMNRMKSIVSFHPDDLDITVQAGIGYIELNDYLKDYTIWFPLDPGPGASVGGMCACRCSGSTAVRYGSMRENVLSLTAVLSDGTVFKTGARARKSSAGYDLTRLLIGSEGTLAIITEATLKLHGIPKVSYAVKLSFPDENGIYLAALTAKDTLNCGVTVGRCELLDPSMITIVNNNNSSSAPWLEKPTLIYELPANSESAALESLRAVEEIGKRNGAIDISIAKSKEECYDIWRKRKECLWSALAQYPDKSAMITDVCVPLSNLPNLINEAKRKIDESILHCPMVAHAGDGNIHIIILFDPSNDKEKSEASSLANYLSTLAISLQGTCTGEHGIGTGKKRQLIEELGSESIYIMKLIKLSFDPINILNPGKVIDIDKHSD